MLGCESAGLLSPSHALKGHQDARLSPTVRLQTWLIRWRLSSGRRQARPGVRSLNCTGANRGKRDRPTSCRVPRQGGGFRTRKVMLSPGHFHTYTKMTDRRRFSRICKQMSMRGPQRHPGWQAGGRKGPVCSLAEQVTPGHRKQRAGTCVLVVRSPTRSGVWQLWVQQHDPPLRAL